MTIRHVYNTVIHHGQKHSDLAKMCLVHSQTVGEPVWSRKLTFGLLKRLEFFVIAEPLLASPGPFSVALSLIGIR